MCFNAHELLQTLNDVADESENSGIKVNKSNTYVTMEKDTPITISIPLRQLTYSTCDRCIAPDTKYLQIDSKKNQSLLYG